MKIIDLLNKIANGEDAPKKIKRANMIYKYSQRDEDYINKYDVSFMGTIYCSREELNKEIEILDDEEKGLPEKLEILNANCLNGEESSYTKEAIALDITSLQNWINKLIDYLEKQRKGE